MKISSHEYKFQILNEFFYTESQWFNLKQSVFTHEISNPRIIRLMFLCAYTSNMPLLFP